MIKVAITGNAGSGKSVVASRLSELGAHRIDADSINASLINISGHLQEEIESIVGISKSSIGSGNNKINKQRISEVIFKNPEVRKIIEKLLHPIIEANIDLQLAVAHERKYAAIEVPLLYEADMHDNFHSVILVLSDKQKLIGRITSSRNINEEQAVSILDCQDDHSVNIGQSDHIIVNNNNIDKLYNIADKLNSRIQV